MKSVKETYDMLDKAKRIAWQKSEAAFYEMNARKAKLYSDVWDKMFFYRSLMRSMYGIACITALPVMTGDAKRKE